jgi:hypothetical protein
MSDTAAELGYTEENITELLRTDRFVAAVHASAKVV